jgi:hypothetical protein
VRASDLLGRDLVLEMLPELFRDHVSNVDGPDGLDGPDGPALAAPR